MAKKVKTTVLTFLELCGKSKPVFTTNSQAATVTEIADNAPGENVITHTKTSTLKFKDDGGDAHTATVTPQKGGYLGTLTLGAVNQSADTVGWTFKLPDQSIDYLQAGQKLVQVYTVTITDGAGQKATATVTITIIGTNDAPVITSKVQSATITETSHDEQGESPATHQATGTVTFADVDKLDTHTAKVVPLGSGYIGTLTIGAVNQATDSIGWTFNVEDSALDPLGPNDVITQKYEVTVNDGHGGTATTVITVTIHGTDDGVTITDLTPAAEGGDVTVDEDDLPIGSDASKESLTATGTFKISAPDGLNTLTIDGHAVITNGVFAPTTFATGFGSTLKVLSFSAATGVVTYTYTLNGAEAHAPGDGENNLFEQLTVVLTDTDGSTASASLDVRIIDDVPHASCGVSSGQVDEDALKGGIEGGTFDVDGGLGTTGTSATGSVASLFSSGADAPLSYSIANDAGLLPSLTSGGTAVSYSIAGNTITATAGGSPIFTFTLDAATGTWTFELQGPIDHAPGSFENDSSIDFGGLIVATDADGDSVTATGSVSVTIDDDTPTICAAAPCADSLQVDETDLGTDATVNLAGRFTGSYGADGPGATAYALSVSAQGVDSGLDDAATGASILLYLEGGQVVGHVGSQAGAVAFTVSVDGTTGAVTLDQQLAVIHSPDAGPDQEASLYAADLVQLTATITDADGDSATATIDLGDALSFKDDAPTASDEPLQSVVENASPISGTFDFAPGADGAGVTAINGTVLVFGSDGFSQAVDLGAGTIKVKADGTYVFTPEASVSGTQHITGTFTVTDSDGDTDAGGFVFDVTDGPGPVPAGAALSLTVDDQNLAGGSTPANPDFASGDVSFTAGSDPVSSFGFSTDLSGLDPSLTWQRADATHIVGWDGAIGTGTKVVTLDITATPGTIAPGATGAVTVTATLVNSYDAHPLSGDDNFALGSVKVVATDSDGTAAEQTVSLGVSDDVPTVSSNAAVQLDDDALTGGNPGGAGDDANAVNTTGTLGHSFGADGGSIAYLTSGAPAGFTYEASGTSLLIKQGATTVVTLTLDTATGAYTVTQNSPILHESGQAENNASFTVSYQVTDGDGDSVTGTLSVNVDDDTPTANADTYAPTITGQTLLSGLLGNDSFGADGVDIATSVSATGAAHGTVVYNNDGTFTYTPNAGFNGTDSFNYTITDADGDSSTATVTLSNVRTNTLPTAGTQAISVDEDGLANGIAGGPGDASGEQITATGTLQHGFNSDGPAAVDPINFAAINGTNVVSTAGPQVTSGGAGLKYFWDAAGDKLYASTNTSSLANAQSTAAFTVSLNTSTGQYTYTQVKPVDHPVGGTEDNVSVDISYRVNDSNGDSATGTLTVTINDDSPDAKNDIATVVEGTKPQLNAILVLDLSLSMGPAGGDPDGPGGFATRLDLMKAAVANLLSSTNVTYNNVTIYTFGVGGQYVASLNGAGAATSAISTVNGLNTLQPGTQYDAAAAIVESHYPTLNVAPADSTMLFFLSDGDPQSGSALDPGAEQTNWLSFLNANVDEVVAVGFGGIVSPTFLTPMAPRGGDSAIAVTNPADLSATLQGTLPGEVSGNVLLGNNGVVGGGDDDGFGADGGRILSIKVGSVTYTYDPAGNDIHASSGPDPLQNTPNLTLTTASGGTLKFDFADGDWDYTAPTNIASQFNETVTYTILDKDGDTDQATLTIAVKERNDAPVNAVPASITVKEDTVTKLTGLSFSDTDIGSSPLTVTLSVPAGTLSATSGAGVAVAGSGTASLTLTGSITDINAFVGASGSGVHYAPVPGSTADVTLTVISNDGGASGFGGAKTDTDTVTLDLVPVNHPPAITGLNTLSYSENAGAVVIDSDVTVTDADSANFNGGSLKVEITANGTAADALAILNQGTGNDQISIVGNQVWYNPPGGGTPNAQIGTWTGGTGGTALVISFTSTNATLQAVERLVEHITFANTSDNPSTSPRTVTYTLVDGDGGTDTGTATVAVNVSASNDAPTIDVNGAASYTVGGAPAILDSTITIADLDNTTLTGASVQISSSFSAGDTLNFVNQAGITGSYNAATGVLTLSGTASLAAYEAALESVTFSTVSASSATRTVSFTVNDGTTSSGADTATVSVTVPTIAPIIVAPATLQFLSESNEDPLTAINHVSFQDQDSSGTVRVTLQMDDNQDDLIASTGGGVTVGGSGTSTMTLDGTIAAINAFLFSGAVQWTSDSNPTDLTGTLTVTIDDNGTTAGGNTVSRTVSISEFTPDGTSPISNDFSAINIDGSPNPGADVFILSGSTGTDTIVTSWWHQPSDVTTIYDGVSGPNDTITLVFTPDQLAEILSNTTNQTALRGFLDGTPGSLDLSGTSWNAEVENFDIAHVSLVTGYGDGTFSLDGILMPTPAAQAASGSDDLILGTSGDNANLGGASGSNGDDVVVGLAGNDSLFGGAGNDLLLGGSGTDTLTGGIGNDVLSGSAGADSFVFAESGAGNVDTVLDYSFVDGDRVVLSSLLDAAFGVGSNISDFVHLVQSGANITVQVDANGTAGGASFVDVGVLSSTGTAGNDPIRLFFEGQDWVLTA